MPYKPNNGESDKTDLKSHIDMLPSEVDRIRMLQTVMAVTHAYTAASDKIGKTTKSKSEVIPKDMEDQVPDSAATIDSSIHSTSSSEVEEEGKPPLKAKTTVDYKTTEDKLTSSLLGSLRGKKKQVIAQERHRRRIAKVLNEELFESVSYSLMLQNKDRFFLGIEDATPEQPEDAFACVALLLSNMILLPSKSGYDARVRHVIKTASVHVLYKNLEKIYPAPIETAAREMKKSTGNEENESKNDVLTSDEAGDDLNETNEEHHTKEINKSTRKAENESIKDVETPHETGHDTKQPDVDPANTEETKTMTLEYPPHPEYIETSSQSSKCLDESYEKNFDSIDCITQHQSHLRFLATRRFEATEKSIATKMLNVVNASSTEKKQENTKSDIKANVSSSWYSRKNVIRGLKIGSVSVVAGTLFAVTGGLAAPGIAAGIAALGIAGGSAAATAAITVLTSTATFATLFGVGGGGLAAYKMKTRTEGLSEFRIRRENIVQDGKNAASIAELHTTVCVSGWLHDKCDFQRPWGITPTDPPITNKLELLRRFYTVHNPEKVSQIEEILEEFKGREEHLYKMLREQYGCDPDQLLPLELDQMKKACLDEEEEKIISDLLGKVVLTKQNMSNLEKAQSARSIENEQSNQTLNETKNNAPTTSENHETKSKVPTSSSSQKSSSSSFVGKAVSKPVTNRVGRIHEAYRSSSSMVQDGQVKLSSNIQLPPTKKSETSLVIWDYQSLYGGDMFTITWESDRLLKFCDLVGTTISKLTRSSLTTLMGAVGLPSTIWSVADMIDCPYQMIMLKADEAGVELANCLLRSEERRPVTLVGFSFGARMIFSCLLELARHQELWEEEQMNAETIDGTSSQGSLSEDDDRASKVTYTREPASIVEDVVLMGLPYFIYRSAWSACRRLVAGRLINCYSRKDWFLSLMFQCMSCTGILRPTCGTHPVTCVEGVENYDVSSLVTSHGNYCMAVYDILRLSSFGKPNPIKEKSDDSSVQEDDKCEKVE